MTVVLQPSRLGDPCVTKWVMERIKFAREIGDQGQADELEPPIIELRCESCGETNQFEMPGIYISPKHTKDHLCIGGDLSCPSCDSLGPFEAGSAGPCHGLTRS